MRGSMKHSSLKPKQKKREWRGEVRGKEDLAWRGNHFFICHERMHLHRPLSSLIMRIGFIIISFV